MTRNVSLAAMTLVISLGFGGAAADQPSATDALMKDIARGAADDVGKDIANGADVNAISSAGYTVLENAAVSGKDPAGTIVRLLLDHGAKVNAKSKDGWTALMFAVTTGHTEAVRVLLAHKAELVNIPTGATPLTTAVQAGNAEIVRLLLEHGADVNEKGDGSTALMAAAQAGHADIVRVLLEHGADVNAKDNYGSTAADLAKVHPDIVAMLRAHGAVIDQAALDKSLRGDAYEGNLKGVQSDVANGANINAKDEDGTTALMTAAQSGRTDIVRWLVEHGAEVDARNARGQTALASALLGNQLNHVTTQNQLDAAGVLLEHRADVNTKDSQGLTPLIHAAVYAQVNVVRWLLDHGADVNATDSHGHAALTEAAINGQSEIAGLLVDHGANLSMQDGEGFTPVERAANGNHPDIVSLLNRHGSAVRPPPTCWDPSDPRRFSYMSLPVCPAAAPARAVAANPQAYFQRLFYTPDKGKAGYHMISKIQAYIDDMPGGEQCGAFSPSGELSVDGTLPPGLSMPEHKTYIEGTPQEPGDWEVAVHFPGVHCTQGGDTADYGDRAIKVHFHIDGDAAKSVDQLQ